ncbi:ester cyclase, partial [Actinomycetospora sp.]|uniref:ester cyclase n=1 Tax=Actinomycetospora sp. TaxID=1872135 RepID=UPI002F404AD4
ELWETGHVDEVDDLLPANIMYHLAGFPDMDRAALKEFMTGFHQSFPDFALSVEEDMVDGERSAHRWSCTATYSGGGGILPGEPTGRKTQATGSHVIHWRDGHPTEIWHFGDWLGWLQGAGVIPAMG